MKLIIKGLAGTRICDWGAFALLRDNVQHYIDGGAPSGQFRALYGIADAVDSGSYQVDAVRLRSEVFKAWCALWEVPLDSAAISRRTHAILCGSPTQLVARETFRADAQGWSLPIEADRAAPVPKAASAFIKAVLVLTQSAAAGDTLEVRVAERSRISTAPPPRAGSFSVVWLPPLVSLCLIMTTSCASPQSLRATTPSEPVPLHQPVSESVPVPADAPLLAPPPAYGNKIVVQEAAPPWIRG